jgi:hypothetical protein
MTSFVDKFNEISQEVKTMNDLVEVEENEKILNSTFGEMNEFLKKSFDKLKDVHEIISKFSNSFEKFYLETLESTNEISWIENNFQNLNLVQTKEITQLIYQNQLEKDLNLEKFIFK